MKRYAVILLATFGLLVGILLIPTTRAERAETQTPSKDTRPMQNRGVAIGDGLSTPQDDSDPQDKVTVDNASGLPSVLNSRSALSAALFTNVGGRGTQFSEATLLANWDGREDFTADHSQKVDDFSFAEIEIDQMLTRSAISEHTVANGFNENVYYYGDTVGNLWIGTDLNPGINASSNAAIDSVSQVNIPQLISTAASGGFTLLNPAAGDCTDDQVVITGIAVTPVADLADFGAACGTIGEVVYVSVADSGGCANNAANQTFRTRILAFGFTDAAGGVTPVAAIQILRNALHNPGGIAVDDNGSLYFHLADRTQLTNAAIFKVAETPRTVAACGGANPRVNRVVASIPSGLSGGISVNTGQGTAAAPILTAAGMRLTNFSGPSTTFGNIQAIAAGPENTIYAAVSRSFVEGDDLATQATEGAFPNPTQLGATPSMIISFADTSGAFDTCSSPDPSAVQGRIPLGDGISDVSVSGTTRIAGVNNFRVFVLGTGPDLTTLTATQANGIGLQASTLRLRMQIDPTIFNGLTVDEEGTVYVISGGTPANVGTNPSPTLGEILAFPDCCKRDRRADFLDLRGNSLPNPPASGGNVGDFDSDRFDHVFWAAPIDAATGTPTGASGLARGFLRYTNRLAPNPMGPGVTLGQTIGTLGDDATTTAAILFDSLDPGSQVSGGDDQNSPFRGDDNDGAGNPLLVGALLGGFEFSFGGTQVAATSIWNGFFLNSNGNITFGLGDTDNTPTITEFRSGAPKIAGAWNDLNPAGRATTPTSFPVQAVGFASVNNFKVRWIGVPEFGSESCTTLNGNTFAISLDDDGTGRDENQAQVLDPADPTGDNVDPAYDQQEGPNDLRFVREPNTNVLIGEPERGDGTGHFHFTYGEMLLLGTEGQPVLTGYSIGGLSQLNPPGLCETNLSEAARAADESPFGVIQGQTASIRPCTIGEGTEPTLYEWFANGTSPALGPGGEIIQGIPDFDLRQEGNGLALSSPTSQSDPNRDAVTFYGVGSSLPPNPLLVAITPNGSLQVAPGQPTIGSAAAGTPGTGPGGSRAASPNAGIINTLGAVPLNLLGTGFFPNEVTTICSGNPPPENAVPTQRPGKTVSTAATLTCDTDSNGIPDSVTALTVVTPLNKNLVRATLAPLTGSGFPGTAFPLACSGGIATITITTTFTAGDNNIFGPFTRTTVAALDLGLRAPVVLSVSPTSGEGNITQTLLISGSSFIINGTPNVTSVYAEQIDNAANRVDASSFVVLDNNTITANFDFGAANAGKTFLIFVSGPNGTSRNLRTATAGAPAGNEQGNQVTFTVNAPPPPPPNEINFGVSSTSVAENGGNTTVTVTRSGDTTVPVTVDYATVDGTALQKSDYTINRGRLRFAAGETSKVLTLLIVDDVFVEGNETFTITLSSPTGGFTTGSPVTVTITDNDTVAPTSNPIDQPAFFVRQQYLDFLGREPDSIGFANWVATITGCPNNGFNNTPGCDRVHVSSSFLFSTEFRTRGYFIERFYEVAFGRRPTYLEFMTDLSTIGGFNSPAEEAANKVIYADEFVLRPAFVATYGALNNTQYVDALAATAGVTLSNRDALIAALNGGTKTRAQVLREIVESSVVDNKFFNTAFVLMQYFGYLRRDPDTIGFNNWLTTLNSNGDFRALVFGFIYSAEYRLRFGPHP